MEPLNLDAINAEWSPGRSVIATEPMPQSLSAALQMARWMRAGIERKQPAPPPHNTETGFQALKRMGAIGWGNFLVLPHVRRHKEKLRGLLPSEVRR